MAEQQYKRLTRAEARRSFAVAFHTRSSLWLGQDHVLLIDTSGFTETYKRFYFRDIQAFNLCVTRRRAHWNWALGILTGVAGAAAIYLFTTGLLIGGWVATFFWLLFGVPLLVNNLRGPTCRCQLRTAVQTEELPSLSRLGKARQVLGILRPLIVQAQGELNPEEIPGRMAQLKEPALGAAAPTPELGGTGSPGAEPGL